MAEEGLVFWTFVLGSRCKTSGESMNELSGIEAGFKEGGTGV